MDRLKPKIQSILHSTRFCGFCLDSESDLSTIDQEIEIIIDQQSRTKSVRAIINIVFKEPEEILASSQICRSCTDKLMQSYIFIENTIETSRIIGGHVNDLLCKSNDIFHHLTDSNMESSNVFIVLENSVDYCFSKETIKQNEVEKAKKVKNSIIKKSIEPKSKKSKFKCVKCNTILPSLLELKSHKIGCSEKLNSIQSKESQKTISNKHKLKANYKKEALKKCRFCQEILHESESLAHMNIYHKDYLHKCHKCYKIFYSLNGLQTHKRTCDLQEKSHCLKCLKLFNEEELRSHSCGNVCPECTMEPCIHHKYLMFFKEQKFNNALKAQCLDCDFVCEHIRKLISHINHKHLNHHPYTCNTCASQFYSKAKLKAHILKFHEEFFVCQHCDSEFPNINVYKTHMKICEDIVRRFACKDCPASFDSSDRLLNHVKLRHNKDMFPCSLCNIKFLKESERLEHMYKVHNQIKICKMVNAECAICQEKFKTKRKLLQHMKCHNSNYLCKICNATFETLRQFKAHYRIHKGPFATCHVCGKEMREFLLKRHLTTHAESTVTCETCGESFRNNQLLKYHQKGHLDSVPCPKCKKMMNPARLRSHIYRHMIAENPLQRRPKKKQPQLKCDQCNYKTYNNSLLECHINRHHEKVKPYVCHICSKAFIGQHLLKDHLKRHDVKSIACNVCLKSFANPVCLKMHLRIHTGEKPFACEICGERFRSSSLMNVHKLRKHSEKSISCPLCSSEFYTVRDMRRHVIKVHWKQKNKPFDPRELKGLDEKHYHLFHDGRRAKVDDEEVEFYMPCSTKN